MLRTVGLWLGLIVLFVVLYQLAGHGTLPPWVMSVAFAAIFLAVFGLLISKQRGAYRVNNDALTQLAEGRVLEALAAFEAAKGKMRNPIPVMNIGYAQLLLWRVHDAVGNLEAFAKRTNALTGVPGGERLAAPSTALAHALLGNATEAKKYIERSPGPAMAKLAEIVIACRAKDFGEAARLFRAHEVVLDQLGGVLRALAETLSAYAGLGGRVDPVRMFRESSADAFKTVWPELHEFIQRATTGPEQGLSS